MNCGRVQESLSDYLEGLLRGDEASRAAAHLRECAVCRGVREELMRFEEEVREVSAAQPVTPQLRERAISDWLGEQEARHRSPYDGLIRRLAGAGGRWVPVSAIVLAGILAAILGLTLVHQPYGQTMRKAALGRPSGTWTRELRSHAEARLYSRGVPPGRDEAENKGASLTDGRSLWASGRETPAPEADGRPHSGDHAGGISFSRAVPGARAPGDLQYLNGNPPKTASGWAKLSIDEWGRIEAQVRQKVRVGDDFVQISLPRVAAVTDRSLVAATEAYKKEAAIVDTRLAREVTCALKAMALSDVCERLRSDTGIHLAAGPSVADEKVTVFCEKLPLREVMRQLSRPFGYTWLRSGKPGEYRYELAQDLKSQLLEEELRNRDRNEALLALDEEMNQYRRYFSLTPGEALAKAKTAPAEERQRLERYAGTGWGPAQMYFRLSPRDIEQLRTGQTKGIAFSEGPGENEHPLPPELTRGVIESMRALRARREGDLFLPSDGPDEGSPLTSLPGIRPVVMLQMTVSDLGQITLRSGTGFHLSPTPGDPRISARVDELAVGISPAVRNPRNGVANARLARDPTLQPRVTVALTGKEVQTVAVRGKGVSPRGKDVSTVNERKVTSADVLEAVHRATGMPIVADYYTRLYPVNSVTLQDRPLFEALNQVCDAMRLRWNKDTGAHGGGGWIQFRSASYFHDRLKEVPNRLLYRWVASRKEHGALTMDDILEIAALPDAQLDAESMAEGAREIHGLAEWDLARNRNGLRPHLRFLAQLPGAQRQEALSRAGLPFTKLSLSQQQQFVPIAFGRDAERLRLEELAKATLRVSYTLPGGFEWRPSGRPGAPLPLEPAGFEPSPASAASRQAALQAALKIDPRANEAQIVPTEMAIMIEYSLGPDSPYRPAGIRVAPGMTFGSNRLEPKEPR